MPLKIFAEIPIDIDRSFNFGIVNPQNGDKVSSALVVEGFFELKDIELAARIIENSQVHPDFDAYMNDIIRCSKRKISKDENVSVGLDEEYRLISFQVNSFEDPHTEGLVRIKFECVIDRLEEGINFLWFSFHGKVLEGNHTPLQYQVIKIISDVNKNTKKIIAELSPSNFSLMVNELSGMIYDTVMYVSNLRSDVIKTKERYDEFTEFLTPNKTTMFSWTDHCMQCILKRIGGNYLTELTEEELVRFKVRLEVKTYSGGIKIDRKSLEGLDGILCSPDVFHTDIDGEVRKILLFQEFIPKEFARGADEINSRFVVYYDYEKVGWSNWHKIRITNRVPNRRIYGNVKNVENDKKDVTDSIWKKFYNSIYGTSDTQERKIIEPTLTAEKEEIGASLIDGKLILADSARVLDERVTAERGNKLNNPEEADQKIVGNNNQLVEFFSLVWKSMTYKEENHQLLPTMLDLNKETPK